MGSLPDMGVEDVKKAVQHAHEALKSWRKTSEYERAAILNKIFQCVAATLAYGAQKTHPLSTL